MLGSKRYKENEIGLWMGCGGRESVLMNASCLSKQTLLGQWFSPAEAFSHKGGLGVETPDPGGLYLTS